MLSSGLKAVAPAPGQGTGAEGEEDPNLDACVLCGLGGNLLCCDACPAAFHLRCIGEGSKTIPDGEWLCAECSMGSRGEPAVLRKMQSQSL